MARRTAALKPQLNQIRTWAREGRTDAWIAYQLGTTALTVQEFRSEHGLDRGGGAPVEEPVTPELVVQTISFDSPPPVAPPAAADEPSEPAPATRSRRQRRSRTAPSEEAATKVEAASEPETEPETEATAADGAGDPERARRRRRRGGRGGGGSAPARGGREPGGGRKACSPAPPSPHARLHGIGRRGRGHRARSRDRAERRMARPLGRCHGVRRRHRRRADRAAPPLRRLARRP